MSESLLLSHDEGGVRILTLNRPQALNSFTAPMHIALRQALADAAADAAVRCLIITGAGRGFCAGQDLAELQADNAPGVGDVVETHYKPLALAVRAMPIPVIAAVNGVAAGAGANLALGCDMVLAARSASFIQAFSKIGLVPDCGGTWLLPRLVGRARALGLAYTGDKLSAEEAQRIGLIWQCVDDAELIAAARALAAKLSAMPVAALAATRRAMDEAMLLDFDAALSLEARAQDRLAKSHDYAEGVAAFLAKRAAVFKDR